MQWCPDRGVPQNVIYEFHCVIHFRFVVCEEKTPNPFTLPRASRQPPPPPPPLTHSDTHIITRSIYLFGSANYISHYEGPENSAWCEQFNVICQIQSFITTTSSLSSFAWTSILALYLYLVIVKSKLGLAKRLMPLFHIVAWLLLLIITLPLLFKQKLGYSPYAASNWCFVKDYLPNNDPKYLCGKLNYEVILLVLVGGKAWEIATYVLVIVLYTAIKWHIHKEVGNQFIVYFLCDYLAHWTDWG